ncbi:MAG: hypothetical protein QW416_00285 [Candidatus Nitrosocaldaceae archaeon]
MKKLLLILSIAITCITIITIQAENYIQESAPTTIKNYTLSDLANSLKPIYSNATIIKGKIDEVDGIRLEQIYVTRTSSALKRENGTFDIIYKNDEAEFSLKYANADDKIIAATITNISKKPFYITGFIIGGGIENGPMPLTVRAIDAGYSPDIDPYPKPSIVEAYMLKPEESLSAMIRGKWNVELLNMTIDTISVGIRYDYNLAYDDLTSPDSADIGITDYKLP